MQLGPWVLPSIQHDVVSVYDFILDTHWGNPILCVHKSRNCCMLSQTCIESITSTPN